MDSTALRAMQAPLKDRYKGDPKTAIITEDGETRAAHGGGMWW